MPKVFKGKRIGYSNLRLGITIEMSNRQTDWVSRGWERTYIAEQGLLKPQVYTRELRRIHACPGLNICLEKVC